MIKLIKNLIGEEIEIYQEKVVEYCSNCDEEVVIEAQFDTLQHCPICGNTILPCSLCNQDTCHCGKCSKEQKKKFDLYVELNTYTNENSNREYDTFKIREKDLSGILFFHFDNMYLRDFLDEYTFDDSKCILEIAKDQEIEIIMNNGEEEEEEVKKMNTKLQVVIDFDIEADDEVMKKILQGEIDDFIDRLENSIGIYPLTPNEDIITVIEY